MMLALLATLLATGQSATPLSPTGRWVVDYEADRCIVSRAFGTDPVTLVIEPGVDMTSPDATLFVMMPNKGDQAFRRGRATIKLQPSGRIRTVDYLSAPTGTDKRGYRFRTDEAMMKDVADWTSVTIVIGKNTYALATGRMQSVMSALGQCKDDLLRSWGVDPAARAVPVESPAAWFGPDSYPSEALSAGAQGRAVLALNVAANGKPTSCRIVITSKNKALDDASCRIAMTRGRFDRASDARERYNVLGVRWLADSF